MENLEILRKRLLYQSQHRGMREMDMLLGGFAQQHIESMTREELKQFETLIALPDQALFGWFFEKMAIPQDVPSSFIKKIQAY